MGFVAGYDYDLFISYASVDNDTVPAADRGWVDTLVQILTSGSGLAGKLGRRDTFTWWMDKQNLRGNHEATNHIPQQVRRSALFLVVLSPGYLASKFCRLELQTFLDSVPNGSGRIFVVNRQPIQEKRNAPLPDALRDLRKYEFWERDKNNKARLLGLPLPNPRRPEDRSYYEKIEDVCEDIAVMLEELAVSVVPSPPAAAAPAPVAMPLLARAPLQSSAQPPDAAAPRQAPRAGKSTRAAVEVARDTPKPRALLAETTDDLLRKRDEVRRYLEQAGIDVLPSGSYYGLSAADYEKAVASDLSQCTAFVQLLGPHAGHTFEGVRDGFGWLQYNVALQSQRPILQWRSLELTDLRAVEDEKQRQLLEAADAMPIEEFKLKILQSLASRSTKPPRPSFFFINCDAVDVRTADHIGSSLGGTIDWERPPYEEKPKAKLLQENIEQSLVGCDGLLIVYGKTPPGWVRAQIQLYRKLRQRRPKEPRVLAVVQAGAAEQLKGIGLAGLRIIGVDDLPSVIAPRFKP